MSNHKPFSLPCCAQKKSVHSARSLKASALSHATVEGSCSKQYISSLFSDIFVKEGNKKELAGISLQLLRCQQKLERFISYKKTVQILHTKSPARKCRNGADIIYQDACLKSSKLSAGVRAVPPSGRLCA